MGSLILQDSFEPYFAGRDEEAKPRAALREPGAVLRDRGSREAIILPSRPAPPAGEPRRDRRPVAH